MDHRTLRAAQFSTEPSFNAIEHDEVQDLAPEPRQHLRLAATEHKLTDTTCHNESPALSLGTVGETTREPHGLPAVKQSRGRTDEASTGRNDFRADPVRTAGQGVPGKAGGHAVGKLTLRHDLGRRATRS